MNEVFLSLGTNLGDRMANLRQAIAMLSSHVAIEKQSSVYETVPFDVTEAQEDFLNMVVHGTTSHDPQSLLRELKAIETNMGRAPDSHNLSKPIDIDILFYEDHVIEIPGLTIPHREIHKRAFVLVPLEEIASFHVHPRIKKPVIDLLDELGGHAHLVRMHDEQL